MFTLVLVKKPFITDIYGLVVDVATDYIPEITFNPFLIMTSDNIQLTGHRFYAPRKQ